MQSERRISIFVSHHVATHKKAAKRIKEILEARATQIDVHICEEIVCGENWMKWIVQSIEHSKLLLVLLPSCPDQFDYINKEIRLFVESCKNGRLVILKLERDEIPEFARDLQVVETSPDDLRSRFLKPLFFEDALTDWPIPLNNRISDEELARDAREIRAAVLGDVTREDFGETLLIDVFECDWNHPAGLDRAVVSMSEGFGRLLNWTARSASWSDLRTRAEYGIGKGTFWIEEMAAVMREVQRQEVPRVMSSTFRGRGAQSLGKIYRPQLARVDRIDGVPVLFGFIFYEVLVPELVRGPELIGAIYNLLHLAGRVRWEVLNPFLLKRQFSDGEDTLAAPERQELIARVSNSMRAIEIEAERHEIWERGVEAFEGAERETIERMFARRDRVKAAIEQAVQKNDFHQMMRELTESLELNIQAMVILAEKFLELAKQDQAEIAKRIAAEGAKSATAP